MNVYGVFWGGGILGLSAHRAHAAVSHAVKAFAEGEDDDLSHEIRVQVGPEGDQGQDALADHEPQLFRQALRGTGGRGGGLGTPTGGLRALRGGRKALRIPLRCPVLLEPGPKLLKSASKFGSLAPFPWDSGPYRWNKAFKHGCAAVSPQDLGPYGWIRPLNAVVLSRPHSIQVLTGGLDS